MATVKFISSPQNPLVKEVLALKAKSKERRRLGRFVIEGVREMELAVQGGYTIETVLSCPEIMGDNARLPQLEPHESIHLSKSVYEKLAHREGTEGVLAIAKMKAHGLDDLEFKRENPLILVAEAPEKPGNIGALLRTADAADLDAVIIANPKTDLYNPNIVRSSVGCLFTVPTAIGQTTQIIDFLKRKQIRIFCAALTASVPYTDCDFKTASALVVGTEATGLSAEWLQHADQNIIIPMKGVIDSLNVSVSAAILIFEAERQRGS
ncbi:MAG: RNA methyltransferase [Flavobacteriaceae bacterium]|nr:RNA methyltransferase [Flavobacteriaceae bacterium]